jgi:hypothetical protein
VRLIDVERQRRGRAFDPRFRVQGEELHGREPVLAVLASPQWIFFLSSMSGSSAIACFSLRLLFTTCGV